MRNSDDISMEEYNEFYKVNYPNNFVSSIDAQDGLSILLSILLSPIMFTRSVH